MNGMRITRVLRCCLIVTLTILCAENSSSKIPLSAFSNPHPIHSAFGAPHSAYHSFPDLNSIHSVYRASFIPISHKIHVSVTYLEFNQLKQTVEIVIRVYTDDLENALSRGGSQAVKIDPAKDAKDKRQAEMVMAYLRKNLELKNKAGHQVSLSWVGIEEQLDMYWLYVKGRLSGGFEGAQIRNKIFCELFDDQVNIVNAKHQGKQIGLMFESKDEFKAIR
jgi:hypothetical protein